MKIYGEKNIKRGIKVGEFDYGEFNDKKSAIGFIRERGILPEYLASLYDDAEDELSIDTENINIESVEYNGVKYWYGTNCFDTELSFKLNRRIGVYRELPDIYDDKTFHWKKNKKYGSMECRIEDNMFEYHCIYMADGNAVVNVKYIACDNYHRNKVTIATIEVEYATNAVIQKGIKQWKKMFKENLKNM